MAGTTVDRGSLDSATADCVVSIRSAFRKVENIQFYLANNPVPEGGVDPLVEKFAYTEDEAYLIRLVFGDLHYLNNNIDDILKNGRKLIGLQ